MLSFGAQKIFLYREPVDMRNSFIGLSCLVDQAFGGQLMSGAYFVFINKRKTLAKILYWDSDGFAIWLKRLEQGTFKRAVYPESEISKRDLMLILEGVEPRKMNLRYTHKK